MENKLENNPIFKKCIQENRRFLIITPDIVQLNPTIDDELNNPGCVIINYSYFDKFLDNYYDLPTKEILKIALINDLVAMDNLYGKDGIVLDYLFNYLVENYKNNDI